MSIEEIIMREDMFAPNPLEFPFGETEERLKAVGIAMPGFRTFEDKKPTTTIRWNEDDNLFYADIHEDGWEKVYPLYKHVRDSGYDVIFEDVSIQKSGQVEDSFVGTYSVASERKGFRTMMLAVVDTRGLDFAHYYQWLKEARHWIENQDDFMAAYSFLAGHPAFWKRPRPEKYPHEWSTDEGVSTIWSYPSYRKDGSIVMMMETGSMVEPERQHRYHDLRLDTYEDTYEKGIIATAKLVHKFFDLDGSERPDVDYKKSELELVLEERMAEANKKLEVDNGEEA